MAWTQSAWRGLKLVIGTLVLLAVAVHLFGLARDLHARGWQLRVAPGWFFAAILLYVLGLFLNGVWYYAVMRSSTTPIPLGDALAAYVVSHLGKYVPGKAAVVVVRVAMSVRAGARAATAGFATLYETLVMMASGALIGVFGFGLTSSRTVQLNLGPLGAPTLSLLQLSLVLSAGFLLITSPWLFPRISRQGGRLLGEAGAGAELAKQPALLATGLFISGAGWLCWGLSQVAVLRAMGLAIVWEQLSLMIASVALATVFGFVIAVSPGGLGVREWVLWTSLGAALDHEQAVLASLGLRLAWIVGELMAAAVCVWWSSTAVRPGLAGGVGRVGWQSGVSREDA